MMGKFVILERFHPPDRIEVRDPAALDVEIRGTGGSQDPGDFIHLDLCRHVAWNEIVLVRFDGNEGVDLEPDHRDERCNKENRDRVFRDLYRSAGEEPAVGPRTLLWCREGIAGIFADCVADRRGLLLWRVMDDLGDGRDAHERDAVAAHDPYYCHQAEGLDHG